MAVDGRRLWRAGLLTLAVFLLAGGGIGFATAAAQGDDADRLTVPAPRPGDRATYSVTQAPRPGVLAIVEAEAPLHEVVYEWLPERMVQDASFVERASQPLQVTYVFRSDGNETRRIEMADFDATTGEPFHALSSGRLLAEPQLLPAGQLLGGINVGAGPLQPPIEVQWIADSYDGSMAPCAQRNALHGAPAVPDELPLGQCGWPDVPRPLYTPATWERLPTGRAFRFDAVRVPLLQAWYDSGSPFPARFISAMSEAIDPATTVDRLFLLERTAWARGTQDYPLHQAGSIDLGDPVPLVPLQPGRLLDDEGLGDELPLSRAYAEAERAPRSMARKSIFGPTGLASMQPSVAEWQADHPDGYLAQAVRKEEVDWYGQVNPYWTLLWVDQGSWLGKGVSWEPTQEDPFSSRLPEAAGRRVVVYDWWPGTQVQIDRLVDQYPPPALLMEALPTATAVAERYLQSNPDARINYYGFNVSCRDGCTRAGADVWAGERRTTFHSATSATGGYSTYSSLTVDEAGLAVQRYEEVRDSAPVLGLDPPTKEETPPAPAAGSPQLWSLPSTPAAATGLSFVALVAGALYYFWPALKGSIGVGLFSRIEPNAVLDLPTRRRIHDAILAEPGIHFMALSRNTDVGRGALDHHLRRLVAADLVVVRKAPGYTCYFAKGAVDRRIAETAPALRSEGSRAVLDAVRAEPGLSCRGLARRLGRSPSTVNYHLQRLREAGLVFGAGAGVHPSPLGEQAAAMAA